MEKNYNDFTGMARQGDVLIFRLPDDIEVKEINEILPENDRLIILEGEMTGHHHAIDVMERPVVTPKNNFTKVSKTVEDIFANAVNVTKPIVRMFKDISVADQLVAKKILTRTDLFLGVLKIEGGGDVGCLLKHEEHDAFRLTSGNYYVGRQIESAGAEERIVAD